MIPLFLHLFGGGILGFLGHALYVRKAQLKGLPTPVANAILSVENTVVAPVASSIAQQELSNLANPSTAKPLPSLKLVTTTVVPAVVSTVLTALTDPNADSTGDPNAPPAPQ
jgi:hypothetical protein